MIPATREALKIFSKSRGKESKKQLLDRKQKIKELDREIAALQNVKDKAEKELQQICYHPASDVVYEGSYYYSEDDYGRRTRWKNMFESIKCELCGSEVDISGECYDEAHSRNVIKFKIDAYPTDPAIITKQVITNAPDLKQHLETGL